MTDMKDECVYFCGPYKGYYGKAEYDHDAEVFHGEVVGTRDVVTFQGGSPGSLRIAFRESVDDYLRYCAERNEQPEKPFSGKFVARIDPDVHRKISAMAELAGKSLNQFVCDCLETVAAGTLASPPSSAGRPKPSAGSRKKRDLAVKHAKQTRRRKKAV